MEIIDAVYNFFRNINTDSKAIKIERITHIILLIASGIIIFRWIQGYYDLLDLVKLPLCNPFPSKIDEVAPYAFGCYLFMHLVGMKIGVFFLGNVFIDEKKGVEYICIWCFAANVTEFICSIVLFIYSVKKVIDYENEIVMDLKYPVCFALIYISISFLSKMYSSHKADFILLHEPTGFCDSDGNIIKANSYVRYDGKIYYVKKIDDNYSLIIQKSMNVDSSVIQLADIIDKNEEIHIYKYR